MKKIISLVFIMTFTLLIGCGKDKGGPSTPVFKQSVVVKNTFVYKKPNLKSYFKTLKRGMLVYVGEKIKKVLKAGTYHVMMNCNLVGEDGEYWVVGKYIIASNNYEIPTIYKVKRNIKIVANDTHYYDAPDEYSKKVKVKKGIKVIVLEVRDEWAKIHVPGKKAKWIKYSSLTTSLSDNSINGHISGIGSVIMSSSSNYSRGIGSERDYSPDKAFDGNDSTSWQEGVDGDGVGEWLNIAFRELTGSQEYSFTLSIKNGYTKSETAYNENGRVKRIKIITNNAEKIIELNDNTLEFQTIGSFKGNFVKLVIDEVYPGTKYRDTVISEIQFSNIEKISSGSSVPSSENTSENETN